MVDMSWEASNVSDARMPSWQPLSKHDEGLLLSQVIRCDIAAAAIQHKSMSPTWHAALTGLTQGKDADLGISRFSSLLSGSARLLSIPLVELMPERYQLCMLFCQLLTAHLQSQKSTKWPHC